MSYIIEANIGIVFLYAVYVLVLARENDFRKQRLALLGVLLCALVFPLITLERQVEVTVMPTITLPEVMIRQSEASRDWIKIIYLTVVGITAIPFLTNAIKLINVFKQSRRYSNNYIVESNQNLPSWSFFNLIYIGRSNELNEEDKKLIMKHEMLHGKLLHSLDMLLITVLCIVFWFNPVLWIMRRTLAKVHEFEVDSIIAKQNGVVDYSMLLAKTALSNNGFLLTHHFNQSFILKRINMISMIKNRISNWKFAGLGVAIVLYFVAVACSENNGAVSKSNEVYATVEDQASPKDGMEAFMGELGGILQYPTNDAKAGIEGTVFVEFVVNKDGGLSDFKVLKGVNESMDAEALRAVSQLKPWNPGKLKGEIVRTKMVLPIKFKLDDPNE